ncbi:transcriptional regulator [Limisalsivibrio acetivorans]|uniref:transcriptional regulator n=1 Tax=Limisalsivibrio acetivorans TaxID=1304888 RepID=UPI0003B4EFF4|nr:transcriptional regulator [Limisalsivibrio acetivorans]
MKTLRQEIIDTLKDGPATAGDLSVIVSKPEKLIFSELEHVRKTVGKAFAIIQPECRKCGFIFSREKHLKKPSKCPECRSTWITDPEFYIK